jgi:ABC-2 type transport system ATP-binding protein
MSVIASKGLTKVFSGKVRAVDGIDLNVEKGEIFGFLGPNGAGKTTTLRMLATLLPIDSGEAFVAGYDVRLQARSVRQRLGYVSQLGGSDRLTTARHDLHLQGRLYGMRRSDVEDRVRELIVTFDLGEFADRRVNTYSGGQRRRLDIALGLVHRPEILFLDEPTAGLDPQNRANLWSQIRRLREAGTTVFLTTHYLEEADMLADRLAIMDHGKIVAEGTSRELKKQITGDCVMLSFSGGGVSVEKAVEVVRNAPIVGGVVRESETIHVYVKDGPAALPELLRMLDKGGLPPKAITLSEPTLDDVFLKQTGRSLRDSGPNQEGGKSK